MNRVYTIAYLQVAVILLVVMCVMYVHTSKRQRALRELAVCPVEITAEAIPVCRYTNMPPGYVLVVNDEGVYRAAFGRYDPLLVLDPYDPRDVTKEKAYIRAWEQDEYSRKKDAEVWHRVEE